MRLEMEYLHLRNWIIFRALARRVHLPRRLQRRSMHDVYI